MNLQTAVISVYPNLLKVMEYLTMKLLENPSNLVLNFIFSMKFSMKWILSFLEYVLQDYYRNTLFPLTSISWGFYLIFPKIHSK